MKPTVHFVSVCMLLASLMVVPTSCSTTQKATAKHEQQTSTAKKKKGISLWHWFGKKQKAYVFRCYQGETLRYLYSYDGLIWRYLNDANGASVTAIPEESIVKRTRVLSKYPEQVSGTLDEGTNPQIMRIGKYTYVYWNKAITKKVGCLRTKYGVGNSKDMEDASTYISFPKGVHLEELYEIKPQTLQGLLGL